MVSYEFEHSSMVVIENGAQDANDVPSERMPLPVSVPEPSNEDQNGSGGSSGSGDTTDVPVVRSTEQQHESLHNEIELNGMQNDGNGKSITEQEADGTDALLAKPAERRITSQFGDARWADLRKEVKILKNRRLRLTSTDSEEVPRSVLSLQPSFSDLLGGMKPFSPDGIDYTVRATRKKRVLKSCLKQTQRPDSADNDHNRSLTELTNRDDKNRRKSEIVMQQAGLLLQPKKKVRFDLGRKSLRWSWFKLPKIRAESDPLVQLWRSIFIVPLAYESWAFPFRLALISPGLTPLFGFDCLCDLWFVFDAFVHVIVAIPGEPTLTRTDLAYRYMKNIFPFQLLPSIVFFFIASDAGQSLWMLWAFGVPRLLPRVGRLRNYFREMEMNLDVDVDKLQFIKFTLVIFLSCHWVGCIYYWLARLMDFRDNTWVGQFETTMPNVFDRHSSPVAEHYLALLYRGWIGLAPNSYRRPPQNWAEQLFSVAVMFMAMYLSAYLIGTVLPYIVKRDPVAEGHTKRRADLLIFAAQRQLPSDLVTRVLEYYDFQHSKTRSSAGGLSVKLSRTLEVKVAKKKFGPYIDRCCGKGQVFFKCESAFISTLVTKLKEVYLMPGEEFIRAGDVARELYFVADGAVQLVEGDAVVKEVRGDVAEMACVVGELSFFLGIAQSQSARTSSESDARMLVLSRDDSEKLLSLYPEQQDMILRNILGAFNLDMHGNDIASQAMEDDKDRNDEQRQAIVVALKRRETEAFAALNFACAMGDIEEVRRLIRRGADINAANYDGRTILHMACHEGNLRVVELLLEQGVDKSPKSRWGITPIMEAIYAKQHQVVHLLLNHKAEMLLDDPGGVLCDWASRGDVDNLKLLLSNGIDPNVGDYDMRTPIHLASSEGQDKVVELLLQHSACVNVKDRWGGTPLKDAVVSCNSVVASLLRNKGGELPSGVGANEFCSGASTGDVSRLRMLHSCGVDPDEGDYDARAPLHLACVEARLLVVSFLLGVSASVNVRDRWGSTPLDECVRGGTQYHHMCGKIMMGWGAELGILAGTAQGEEGLRAIERVSMADVSSLIKRLIASGLYDRRQKTLSDQELMIAKEGSMRLVVRGGEFLERMRPYAEMLDQTRDTLDVLATDMKKVLWGVASILDAHPVQYAHAILNEEKPVNTGRAPKGTFGRQGTLKRIHGDMSALKSAHFASSSGSLLRGSGGSPLAGMHLGVGHEHRHEMQTFFEGLNAEHLNAEVLLEEEVDDAHAALYAELDELVKLQERSQALGPEGRANTAKNLNRILMQLFEVENMILQLEEVFKRCGSMDGGETGWGGVGAVNSESLLVGLNMLGVSHIDAQESQEIIDEALDHPTSSGISVTAQGLLSMSPTFRSLLYSLEGSELSGHEQKYAYLSKCSLLKVLPYSFLKKLSEDCEFKVVAAGSVVLQKGVVPSALHIIKIGSFVLEGVYNPETRKTEQLEMSDEAILAPMEFFMGERLHYSVRATVQSEVIQVKRGQLAALLQGRPQAARRVAQRMTEMGDEGGFGVGSTAAFVAKWKGDQLMGWTEQDVTRIVGKIHERFDAGGLPDLLAGGDEGANEPDVLLQDLRLGLKLVQDSWELFGYGAETVNVSYFQGIKENLGEVGTRFFEQVMGVIEGKEEVTVNDWWNCWIEYLNSTGNMNTLKGGEAEAHEEDHTSEVSDHMPTRWELVLSVYDRMKFRRRLLRGEMEEKYEAAFLVVQGNLTDPIPRAKIPHFITTLLHLQEGECTSWMVYEFLVIFGKHGPNTKRVSWGWMRKTTTERINSNTHKREPVCMPGSTVFNPLSPVLMAWFNVVRLVAAYHFIVVPVRLVYQPFKSLSDLPLLCSDLIVDGLTIMHVLVCFNTSYQNKKSRWVTVRSKIAKKYLSGAFYVDILSAFPVDWIIVLMGVDLHAAEWTRLLKMVLTRVLWSGFMHDRSAPSGLGRLAIMAFMVLHLSACMWSGLGLADDMVWTMGGNTWFRAESSQEFIIGLGHEGEISMWELYTTSLNWVATHTVSAIGNTTLYPKNYLEIIFKICQLTVGMTFYRMVLGQISSKVMKRDEKIIKVRGELGSLEGYIVQNRLSDDEQLVTEIRRHFQTLQQLQTVDMGEVFDNLNNSLQFDMARLLCREALDNAELFLGCSQSMLDRLSVILREVQFAPEEELFQAGDVPEEMYLVVSGSVEKFNVDPSGQESSLGSIKQGSAVGDVSFAFGMKHLYGARASAVGGVTCLRLVRASYLQVLKLYPEDEDVVAQNSLTCFERAKVEHGSSKAGSKKGTSAVDQDAAQLAMQETKDDRSFDSDANSDSEGGGDGSEFDQLIGSGIAQHIQALKVRQANSRVLQLLEAAFNDDRRKLQKLINRGVSVNDSDPSKRTPLHIAASEGHLETVRLLLELGADTTAKDMHGNTPLNDAVRHKHDEVCALIRELRSGSKVSFQGSMGAVQLCQASFEGDLDMVKRLIANGLAVNEADYDQRTPLHLAACEGHTEVVKHLLDNSANVNARDRFMGTPLQDAVRHQRQGAQELLRAMESQIVGMDTAVSMCQAAAEGDLAFIRTLVENGVDPNLPDYDKRTAMHLAASNGRVEVLNFLLTRRPAVNVNPVDITGGTPLEDAVRHGQEVTRKMMEVAGGLRKGEAALAQLLQEQEEVNRRQASDMRQPEVTAMVMDSPELRQDQSVEVLLKDMATPEPPLECERDLDATGATGATGGGAEEGGSLERVLEKLQERVEAFAAFLHRIEAILVHYLPNVDHIALPRPVVRESPLVLADVHQEHDGGEHDPHAALSPSHARHGPHSPGAHGVHSPGPHGAHSPGLHGSNSPIHRHGHHAHVHGHVVGHTPLEAIADAEGSHPLAPAEPAGSPVAPAAMVNALAVMKRDREWQHGHGLAILPEVQRELDDVIVALTTAYQGIPPFPEELRPFYQLYARQYVLAVKQVRQQLLMAVALGHHLRHMARQNMDHHRDAH